MKDLKKINRIISSLCSKHPSVAAAYLFGSVAKQCSENPKDVDVAVLLDQTDSGSFDMLLFVTEFEEYLGCRADVVIQ